MFFALLVARDLYNGRGRRALLGAAGLLLCGDVAAIYPVAVGLSALITSRGARVAGAVLVALGVAWLGLISGIGADAGSGLARRFGYLTNGLKAGQNASILWVIQGMLDHPSRLLSVLHHQWALIVDVMRPGGVIGVISPWGMFIAAFALIPNALVPGTLFIRIGFQNVAVSLFAIVGSTMIVDWFSTRGRRPRRVAQHGRRRRFATTSPPPRGVTSIALPPSGADLTR